MGKITLQDTMLSSIVKMADGNPGAVEVLTKLLLKVPQIDGAVMDGFLYVLFLDDLGVYGTHIWQLFKYVCGEDIAGVVTLLRARQLGHLSTEKLRRIMEENELYDWKPLVTLIQKHVPEFNA